MITFISKEELCTAIGNYQLAAISTDDTVIHRAILAAIGEATSYLNSKYDCDTIFSAVGDNRNPLVLEHCKSMAVWYLLRLSNADMIYERAKEYYTMAVDWFKLVAGVDPSGRTIAPNLPVKSTNGEIVSKIRFGTTRKFTHSFED